MVEECGEAPKSRCEHKGIVKQFFKKLYNEKRISLLIEEEMELIEDFYEERRMADYMLENIDKNAGENYISLTAKPFEVVNGN